MSLSCDYYYDPEPGDVVWQPPTDWRKFDFRRAPKCCSCGSKIKDGGFGKDALEFERFKIPDSDVEVRIYGEDGEIPRASWWMCFECGWRYQELEKAGYAVDIRESMVRLLIEHEDLTSVGLGGCL